ncbi:MAG: cytochrome c biogenesis protein CcdA [Minwuiales bacterium]|nr:cytochrome c biogenesis protein CcdA [Minwuiales bacterium]
MATLEVSYIVAAGGGLLSFLSPCVLPLVPAYLSYVAGTTFDELTDSEEQDPALARRVVAMSLIFVLGFSTVFVLLGASASAVNRLIIDHLDILGKIAGVAIVIFGLHFMGIFKIPLLYREARVTLNNRPAGYAGSYLVGVAFGFGWTPCIGPILATILAIAASDESLGFGVSLLTAYSLGLGIPFVAAAFAVKPFIRFMRGFRRHIRKVELATGALMVATGALIFSNSLQVLSYWMLDAFPFLATIG